MNIQKNSQNFFQKENSFPFRLNSVNSTRKSELPPFTKFNNNTNNNENIIQEENIGQKTFSFDDIIFTSEFNSGNMTMHKNK